MFKLFLPSGKLTQPRPSPSTSVQSSWLPCSDIFYLLNTIRLTCDLPLGKLTLEDISPASLSKTLLDVRALNGTTLGDSPWVITVCGVTWDILQSNERDSQKRIRAIPKAAGLRFFDDQRAVSDAYFYQAKHLAIDSVPSDYFTERLVGEAKTLAQLTPEQFVSCLKNNNEQFIQKHGRSLHLQKSHFEETISTHEQAAIAHFQRDQQAIAY